MDLNQLLSNHQRALMNANHDRQDHVFRPGRILCEADPAHRDRLGLPRAPWLVTSAPPEEDHWLPAL